MEKIMVIHDWDFPLYQRWTCIKRAFWLVLYALFGWAGWFRSRMPRWMLYEKYSQAMALAEVDKILNVKAIFGLTKEVKEVFPDVREKLEEIGFEVRHHYHVKQREVGKGRWKPTLDVKPHNMVYDRRYVLWEEKELPLKGEKVVWHVDHLNYNLSFYLDFIKKCREKGLL